MTKKKILLLSDDLRMSSGIATMSKELVFGTLDKFDWVQLGAAVQHPDKGKEIDLGEDARRISGISDASVKIIPWTGYGDANILRELLVRHQPDAILHFTDPRYWRWLYEMEAEIRQNIPILFYHIWDDLPDPDYNRDYYESCDWLGCISRQTYGIVKRVGSIDSDTIKTLEDWQVSYVPHGIDSDKFKPMQVPDEFRKNVLGDKEYKFVLFWMNRNIRRKQPSDVIWAFKKFRDELPEEDKDKVCGFRFKKGQKLLTHKDYEEIGSLHNWREWEKKVFHGEWVKPVWPRVQTMVGSVPTPYIIDDKVDVEEVALAIRYWFDKNETERMEAGQKGREMFLGEMGLNSKNMCKQLSDGIKTTFKKFKPKERFNVYKVK
jgi:glycosyltransferase involved in cell wall biosynthesis